MTRLQLVDQGGQGSGWRTRQSHIHMWINQEEQLGSETDCTTQGSSVRKKSLTTSDYKNLCRLQWWEKLPVSQRSQLEGPTGS